MPERNFDNRTLFWGDNIDFLRAMNSETVDLIATDPPFNKGRDFHATPDSLAAGASFQDRWKWDEEAHPQFTDALRDDPKNKNIWTVIQSARSSWGDDMGAFLCFMGVRLMEMRRVLKQTGSIYLHCDPTASHYLKALMDAVFGRKNFRNEIVWRRSGGKSDAKRWGRVADRLLYYTCGAEFVWNPEHQPHDPDYVRRTYRYDDNDGLGVYRVTPLHASGQSTGESGQPWRGVDPGKIGNHWRTPTKGVMNDFIIDNDLIPGWPNEYPNVHARLDALDAAGLVVHGSGIPRVKTYLAATKGIAATDVITDISMASGKERVGYPTQKPLALYERIIRVSSNEGDLVLDPFAGCATTAVAAERLNRQWVAIDLWKETKDLIVHRLEAEKRMFAVEQLTVTQTPPARTDEGEVASPDLRLRMSRQPEKWQRLYRQQIFDYLQDAQTNSTGLVSCAGCGRSLEYEFMELDHILPRSEGGENYITNRILLCRPCNGRKSDRYTLRGLRERNKKDGWMRDEAGAESAQLRARRKANEVRETLG